MKAYTLIKPNSGVPAGMELALKLALDDAEQVRDYFLDRADCDWDGENDCPNLEMRLQGKAQRVVATLENCIAALETMRKEGT